MIKMVTLIFIAVQGLNLLAAVLTGKEAGNSKANPPLKCLFLVPCQPQVTIHLAIFKVGFFSTI